MKSPTPDEIRNAIDRKPVPEPPAGLAEVIQRQIPDPLPRRESPAPWGRSNWLRLAATLILVAGGVVLGYKLALWMRAPAGSEAGTVARLVPRGSDPLPLQTTDLPIQAIPASYTSARESPRSVFGAMPEPFPVDEARRYLALGELPPPDAIPPLSWAGYFDAGGDGTETPDALVMEGGPSPLSDDPSYRLVRVTVDAPSAPRTPRPPMDLTVRVELREANGRLEEVERSLRQAAAGLQAHDRMRMVFERELAPDGAQPKGVRLKERQEFVFVGEPEAPIAGSGEPVRRIIRITRDGDNFAWADREADQEVDESETRTIVLRAPAAPPAPPAPSIPPAPPALPSRVSIQPSDLSDTLRETVRELAGGREVAVEFNPRAVEYYRLVGEGRPACSGRPACDKMVALYEIKLAPGASDDAIVATLTLDDGALHKAMRSAELSRAQFAASFEQATAAFKAASVSARVSEALARENGLQECELRKLVEEARRLAGEKVLRERQALELQRMAEIAAQNAEKMKP